MQTNIDSSSFHTKGVKVMFKKFFLLPVFLLTFNMVAFAEVINETLVVEYSRGILPAQQALIQEMINKGLAQPISENNTIKGFTFLLKDPVHHILRQGRMYKREYPLKIMGEKQFEVLTTHELSDGIGAFFTGFQMGLNYGKSVDNETCYVFFHAENHKLENILGKNTARVRTYHSAGSVNVYPNSGMVIVNIDGEGGFIMFTYMKTERF